MLHDSLGASVNMKQTVVFFVLMSCGLLFPKVTRPRGGALYSMPLSFRGAMSFDPSSQSTPKLSLGFAAEAPLPFLFAYYTAKFVPPELPPGAMHRGSSSLFKKG